MISHSHPSPAFRFFSVAVLLFLGLSFSFQSQAQCPTYNRGCCSKFSQTHLRLGGTLHGIGSPNTPVMGTTVGLVHELHLASWFQLRGEANVLWQGREDNFWVGQGDADYFSVNLPVMLQIMPSRRLYVAGGLGLSYLVHTQGGIMPNNRLGLNLVGLLHYRFHCSPIGLELRYQHRTSNRNATAITDANGNVIAPFDDSSLQCALTVRF